MTQSFYKSGNFCIGHFRTLFQSCLPFSEAVLKSIFKTQMVPFFEVEKLQVRLNTMMLRGRFLILNLVIVQSPMRVWNWIYLGRRRFWSCQKKNGGEYRTLTVDCLWSFSPWLRIQSTWIEKWKTQPGRKKDQLSTSFCYFLLLL